MNPEVSVVMPAYNSAVFIEMAIRSVQLQTIEDWELIVVDDCSTDNTYQLVLALAEQDPRIRLIHNEVNIGVAGSRNRAFQLCRGMYVALLDSDDLWEPTKLEKQIACAKDTGASIVYCSYAIIGPDGEKKCPDFIVPRKTTYDDMLVRSTISCSTALLHRNLITKYHFTDDVYHEDYAYWLTLLRNDAVAVGLDEVLASYRVTNGSRASNKRESAINRWIIYRKVLGLSVPRSGILMVRYATYGILKYRRWKEEGNEYEFTQAPACDVRDASENLRDLYTV